MTEEEKQLLFQDLCARLPYGVKISVPSWDGEKQECIDKVDVLYSVNRDEYIKSTNEDYDFNIEDIKPYLFPMSSMTEEQKDIYCQLQQKVIYNSKGVVNKDVMNYVNWCYENHLDVNDLIPNDLAIDATGKNIY
jgi:hypothetical protein